MVPPVLVLGTTIEITHYGPTCSRGLSSCLSVVESSPCASQKTLCFDIIHSGKPCSSLSVKKANCNLFMMFRMMRRWHCTCQSLPAPLTKTHPQPQILFVLPKAGEWPCTPRRGPPQPFFLPYISLPPCSLLGLDLWVLIHLGLGVFCVGAEGFGVFHLALWDRETEWKNVFFLWSHL